MLVRNNIVLFLLLILAFMLSAAIKFEVSIGPRFSAADIPVKEEIFSVFFLLAAILFMLKAVNRWTGLLYFMRHLKSGFTYWDTISSSGRSRMITYNILETAIYVSFAYGFIYFIPESFALGILCLVMSIELILYSVLATRFAGIGVRQSSVVVLTRMASVIPFKGLTRIERDFDEWFFRYRSGKVRKIHLHTMKKQSLEETAKLLRQMPLCKDVFFSDNLIP